MGNKIAEARIFLVFPLAIYAINQSSNQSNIDQNVPSFCMIKFNYWFNSPCGSALFCPAGNPSKRSRFSRTPDLRAQAALIVRTDHSWPHWPLTVGDENSAFTHLESSINTCITSHLPNFCEVTIPCLLKSRQRFEIYDFDLTDFFKHCASYQVIFWNCNTCIIFISLVTCKYDMTSCPASFTTYLDRHRGYSRKVSFQWL